MHRFVNGKVVIGLTVSTTVLLIACLVLASELLARSRFEQTRQEGVMFDTKSAELCDADGPINGADDFKRFVELRQAKGHLYTDPNDPARMSVVLRPFCHDLK